MKYNETKLDEGFVQNVFNYLYKATGNMLDKIPVVGDKREEARTVQKHTEFVNNMSPETIDRWIGELQAKLKSEHPSTAKAADRHLSMLRKSVQRVIDSTSSSRFKDNMHTMQRTLKGFEKFRMSSNNNVMKNRRKARQTKADMTMGESVMTFKDFLTEA